jgi:hypothetical protein
MMVMTRYAASLGVKFVTLSQRRERLKKGVKIYEKGLLIGGKNNNNYITKYIE